VSKPDPTGPEQAAKASRGAKGRFKPGQSGNPAGRPRGRRDKRTEALCALMEGSAEDVVNRWVGLATKGAPWAVRMFIERVMPRLEKRLKLELPPVRTAADVSDAIAAVIDQAASGDLTLEEARAVLALIEQQRKALETTELALQLQALQEQQARESEL